MDDKVFKGFLQRQRVDGCELAAQSDILRLRPLEESLPRHYVAEFRCRGVVRQRDGRMGEGGLFAVGVFFPDDYLRRAASSEVLTWFHPDTVFHPNILGSAAAICIGRLQPGTNLVDILYQVYEIIVYHKWNSLEYDSLNPAACAWARANQNRFPTDPRPLRRPRFVAAAAAAGKEAAP